MPRIKRVRRHCQLLLGRNERQAIRRFFSLPDSQRQKIQKYGVGVRWVLVPGSLGSYPRHSYPELYSNREGKNGRFPEIQLERKKYIVIYNLSEDFFKWVRGFQKAIVIPSICRGENIVSFLLRS